MATHNRNDGDFPTEEAQDTLPDVAVIYRKVPVGHVDMNGDVPFEAAVLIELGHALVKQDDRTVNVVEGAMHDKYESTWNGQTVLVKLGDFATEDS